MLGFFEKVYKLVRKVPAGKVVTYGQIAKALGTRDSRKAGWALHANSDGEKTPCHRVVNKVGRLAPNFAFGGEGEQRLRLEKEGLKFNKDGRVEMKKHQFRFDEV
ncbi:MAG: MGMT family protein [Patescibacteria group bacterium]|nr:MGMT family protein [Patescibacteria group bacterium]